MWHSNWHGGWHHNWHGVVASQTLPGQGQDGVGSFALELQNGYSVTYRWVTDVIKKRSGKEQRISRNDRPLESYDGKALLLGAQGAEIRTQLAQFAAQGKTFLLGQPHEELTLRADSAGTTVYVTTTAKSDWMNPGQRVVIVNNGQGIDAVIQSTTADTITLDVDLGGGVLDAELDMNFSASAVAVRGARIMPAMPILLEPQQAMPRYRTAAEQWNIKARATQFDYARPLATLALGPITLSAGFDNLTVVARVTGITTYFELENGGAVGVGELSEAFGVTTFRFQPGVTTMANLASALAGSVFCALTGTYNGADTIAAGDAFLSTQLTGGQASGPVGTGAVVTQYAGRPLWDRKLENKTTITDSIHALTEIIDHGGTPYALGWADMADWGRAITISGKTLDEWQWLKLFIATVKGRQKSFYLSTYRNDLPFVSKATNTITVTGNVGVWWPLQRRHIEIRETSGVVTRAEVTAATDNGNGTWTLTIGTTLASSAVNSVSWLEVCRFTSDEFVVTFDRKGFSLKTVATIVQPSATSAGLDYGDDEASDEASEPRELIKISINNGIKDWLHTSASRDIVYGGQTYKTIAIDRSEQAITMPGEEREMILTLPIDHEFCKRFTTSQQPPLKTTVTITRVQASGAAQQIWVGDVTAMAAERGLAKFRVPSRAGVYMLRTVPSVQVGRACPHMLYGPQCKVSRTGASPGNPTNKQTVTVTAIDGRSIWVDLSGVPVAYGMAPYKYRLTWAEYGEVFHAATGERMTVLQQNDLNPGVGTTTKLTLSGAIVGLAVGHSVDIYAGCDWQIETCDEKFGARQNFGGMPQLSFENPFVSTSDGTRGLT